MTLPPNIYDDIKDLQRRLAALERTPRLPFASDVLRIYKRGTVTVTVDVGQTIGYQEISHDLGYAPAFFVYYDGPTQVILAPFSEQADTFDIYITASLLYIGVTAADTDGRSIPFRYYIFKEAAN